MIDIKENIGERIGERFWKYYLIGPQVLRFNKVLINLNKNFILLIKTRN